MRSIHAQVLLWSLGTFALSLVAYWGIERTLHRHGPPEGDPFVSAIKMVEDDVCRAYETGGSEGLSAYLQRLNSIVPGEHFLTDTLGRDLVSGQDRSHLLRAISGRPGPDRLPDGRIIFVGRSPGKEYRFITVVRPWFEPPNILPYYGAVVLVIAGMGSILAVHLAAPLRQMRRVVERFGRGDLAARTHSTRRDELGALARALDEMADRIETLLSAERRLLQDVSHELRSPLARLGFAIELARKGADRDSALDRVRKEADRMASLIGELLRLTRDEGDPAARAIGEVSLGDLLGLIVRDCGLEAEAKGCRLRITIDRELVVRGERELLHRAFENIVRNAIRHAPAETAIDVNLVLQADVVTISVRDYGSGVPDALLDEIFRPFFRVEKDRSRSSGGVGLGLSIARRAVDLHEGRIAARNASPGLLVSIELPAVRVVRAKPIPDDEQFSDTRTADLSQPLVESRGHRELN